MGSLTYLKLREDVSVIGRDDGVIACSCPRWSDATPCKHVFYVMRDRSDLSDATMRSEVYIPMYEEPVDGAHLIVRVRRVNRESIGTLTPFYLGSDRVGWVDECENRWAMRRVLFEWFRARYPDAPACREKGHSNYLLSAKERSELKLDATLPTVIAGIASVLNDGRCWRCVNKNNLDLVPAP